MKKRDLKITFPTWVKLVLFVSFIFYVWYLASTLLLPLKGFVPIPEFLFITLYKLAEFPPSLLGFIICVSIISSLVVLSEFKDQTKYVKLALIEGTSFFLYFIIPIIATVLLLAFIFLRVSGQIPTESRIAYFLEDLFLFTSALFILTAVLNVATQRIFEFGKYYKK